MTTAELADRIGISPALLAELLEESRAAGVVMPTEHGWRLAPDAEERYGAALRAFCLPSADDRSRPAGRPGDVGDFEEAA